LAGLYGLMENNIRDIGRIIKWMERVFLNGQMEGYIKEIMLKIKNKAMGR